MTRNNHEIRRRSVLRLALLGAVPGATAGAASAAEHRITGTGVRQQSATDRQVTDTTPAGNAQFSGSGGDYTISAAGHDVWTDADEYGAVYERDVAGDFTVETTVESQEATNDWAKAGLMVAADITLGGGSAGDLVLAVTPENGFVMDWDDNGDGYISEHRESGSTSYPCRLRLEHRDGEYTGSYSTDGGETWTTLATTTLDEVGLTPDVGCFATSHVSGTRGTVEFGGFSVEAGDQPIPDTGTDLPNTDTTDAGDARFNGSGGEYTVSAAGQAVGTGADEYAAVYERDISTYQRDVVAETSVESQEDTDGAAMAGIMAADDITAGGESTGDVAVAVTPDEGFVMKWDGSGGGGSPQDNIGNGYLGDSVSDGSVSYPCRLRLSMTSGDLSATTATGEYSTDGGESWTTLAENVALGSASKESDFGVFVSSHEPGTRSVADFSEFAVAQPTRFSTADTTDAGNAVFEENNRVYTIEAAGEDIWMDTDEYGAIHRDISGNTAVQTTVESQEDTHDWAKAGLMVANDITAGGESTGDVVVGVTPANGFIMDWDDNGDGYLSEHREGGSAAYPCELRLERVDGQYVGSYSTDGGDSWTTLGTATPNGTVDEQDAGMFTTSHVSGTRGTTVFDGGIDVESIDGRELLEVDTTAAGDATFDLSEPEYVIEAAGHDVWSDADEYGAIYEPDISGDFTVETSVESQEATHDWAKAGLMVANDVTAPGSSAGDVVVGVTPANGYIMDWDGDGDGYLSTHRESGSSGYPTRLRLQKSGAEFTGEYSTDGGETWTTLASATLADASDTQDVALFATSHDNSERSRVAFREFLTR
jgi:regulation of enolase protein 1 (concanavalin A-like superfamily)